MQICEKFINHNNNFANKKRFSEQQIYLYTQIRLESIGFAPFKCVATLLKRARPQQFEGVR